MTKPAPAAAKPNAPGTKKPGAPSLTGASLPAGSLKSFQTIMRNDLGNPALGAGLPGRRQLPAPPNDRLRLRLGSVASDYLNLCLDQSCRLRRLRPLRMGTEGGGTAALREMLGGLDMVLIEVNWHYQNQGWAAVMRDAGTLSDPTAPLARLLACCREMGIPTALWITADRNSLDIFAHLHGAADATFAADPAVARALPGAHLLLPAVAPTLHNPLIRDAEGMQYVTRNFGLASDSYNELCGFDSASPVPGLLEPGLDYLFWLFETRYSMRNTNARLDKNFRRRFLGCLEDADRATILRHSGFYLSATGKPGVAQPDKTRNMLEAMACKSLVLTDMDPVIEALEPFLCRTPDGDAMRAALRDFSTNPHLHRMTTHLAYREVLNTHTYAHRLETMGQVLGIAPGKTARPAPAKITALVPTMRPELLPFVLEGYRRQNHPDLEMVIVLHSDSHRPSDIAPMLRAEDNARVLRVPESQSVGMALNVGIDAAEGAYWARIDDDDYYGPNYFGDAMLNRHFMDFDICGKSQWIVYFEALEGAFLHKKDWAAHSTNPVIAGGTFLIRNSGEARLRFDDRVRGYADVDLIGRAVDAGGARIISSDPFNFLQIRRMDRKSHTWTVDVDQIRRAEQVTQGLDLARIGI